MKNIYWLISGLALLACAIIMLVPSILCLPDGSDADAVEARATVATLIVTILAGLAALITISQSTMDYAAAHAPKLEAWYVDTNPIEPYKPFLVNVHVVNTGRSRARLRTSWPHRRRRHFRSEAYVLITRDDLALPHPDKPFYAATFDVDDTFIEVGQYRLWSFSSHISLSKDQYKSVMRGKGEWSLYVVGLLKYGNGAAGGSDAHHRTLFCRKYDNVTKRFMPVDDKAYEYMT